MRIKIFNFEPEVILSPDCVSVIEVHNKVLFRKIISNMVLQSQNLFVDEKVYIYDNSFNEYDWRGVHLLTDIYNPIMNIKIESLLKNYLSANHQELVNDICAETNQFMEKIANQLIYDLMVDIDYKHQFSLIDLIKFLKFKLVSQDNVLENWYEFLEMCTYFYPEDILVSIGLKQILSHDECQELFHFLTAKGLRIVNFENVVDSQSYLHEKKLIIDNNFDSYLVLHQ